MRARKEFVERNELVMMLDNLSEGTDLKNKCCRIIFSKMQELI